MQPYSYFHSMDIQGSATIRTFPVQIGPKWVSAQAKTQNMS